MMRPITKIGVVLFNGGIDRGAVISASNKVNPYYPPPKGQFHNWYGKMRYADIAWRFIDEHAGSCASTYNNQYSNATVTAMVAINGQGTKAKAPSSRKARHVNQNEFFLSRINILGLVDAPNDENESPLFNIHCGGIQTITNISNVNIRAGDWLIAYAPRLEEVGEGGRRQDADNNGVMTLWLKPYSPSDNANTPPQILQCLTEVNESDAKGIKFNRTECLPEYVDQCERLFESFVNIGVTFMKWVQTKEAGKGDLTNSDFMDIIATLGHQQNYNAGKVNYKARQSLTDALFACVTHEDLFSNADSNGKKLNKIQRQGVSLALAEQARYIHGVTKNIMGKALTSMEPGQDGMFQHCSYMS